ncbi:flotillin family protein [Pseudomonadota bacterium]
MADLTTLMPIATGIGIFFVIIMGMAALFKSFYVKVDQGTALIVNDMSAHPKVHFTGALVYPIIYKKELMRISLITLEVDRRGKDGLICLDNMRADIAVAFYLRVNETTEDVLKVAKSIGANRASDKDAVDDLFSAKFSEALKTVGKQIEFVQLFENRQEFREKIIEVIGDDLNGYVLEDVAIDYLEQTPKAALDPDNILDSQGIRKITELTAEQNVQTNILEKNEELAITKKNVETKEAMLALERQQADAEAKQEREIATIRAREEAETMKVQEEERKKAEATTIQVNQDLAVQKENQQREIEVAEQNRQRAVSIEIEKVTRAKDLEIVSREREVEIQRIEAEKAIEIEKKEIANVVRERVMVDKTVAIEEERIKEVREVSEADRAKQVQVLAAEASADEEKVKQVKAAEAEELSARHKASQITTLAQANLDAAAKEADGEKKLAEGMQASSAAPGLAEAKVQEAKADAYEKQGLAEAKVIEVKGTSEASAIKQTGVAEADVTREQFKAEAEGLVDKFDAMGNMSDKARDHEEFRMSLETALKEAMASIEAGKEIAQENAEVLASALKESNIDIVGGEGHFFDTFAKSLSMGKAVDGFASKSGLVTLLIEKFMANKLKEDADENSKQVVES